jgi:hypothetical protein
MTTLLPPGMLIAQESAIQEWERLMRQIGALAEQCIDLTARPDRLWLVNQLDAMIAATDHGAKVGDSGYTRESALAARAFVQAFMAFAMVPLVVDVLPDDTPITLTPLMILSARM